MKIHAISGCNAEEKKAFARKLAFDVFPLDKARKEHPIAYWLELKKFIDHSTRILPIAIDSICDMAEVDGLRRQYPYCEVVHWHLAAPGFEEPTVAMAECAERADLCVRGRML